MLISQSCQHCDHDETTLAGHNHSISSFASIFHLLLTSYFMHWFSFINTINQSNPQRLRNCDLAVMLGSWQLIILCLECGDGKKFDSNILMSTLMLNSRSGMWCCSPPPPEYYDTNCKKEIFFSQNSMNHKKYETISKITKWKTSKPIRFSHMVKSFTHEIFCLFIEKLRF